MRKSCIREVLVHLNGRGIPLEASLKDVELSAIIEQELARYKVSFVQSEVRDRIKTLF